jgi:putative transposase
VIGFGWLTSAAIRPPGRVEGFDEAIISLYAKGLTTGEIQALRQVYTAPTVEAAEAAFTEFTDMWGGRYPAVIRLWRNAWETFTPFLAFPPEIRRIVYTTNAVESLNARFRQATRRRGHFPTEQAALKVLYHVIRSPRPNRASVAGKTTGWKTAINALAMYYGERITEQ